MSTHFQIAVVGSGFAGIGAAIRLKQAGFHDFVVLERADAVGGTWRDNTYPGCACDVESHLYSFSFAPNPHWSRLFSPQTELHAYLDDCARRFGVVPHIRFGHQVLSSTWLEDSQCWRLETTRGAFTADVLVAGSGALSEPSTPRLPGLNSFAGKVFHSARWDHTHPLNGKRVAVIGTGASAIQFVPAIQPQVAQLTLFQRTPAWVVPRFDRAVSAREQRVFAALPIAQKLVRLGTYLRRETFVVGFRAPPIMRVVERYALRYLERTVKDPVLRQKLTPSFRMGCKRILISSDYLPALTQPNVQVVTDGIREVRPQGVVTHDGVEHAADTIIFGTGFQVAGHPSAHITRGRSGRTLAEAWQGSPKAYLGTMTVGFPNLFLLTGPNTGLGHNSMLLMIESQLNLLVGALEHMRDQRVSALEPRPELQASYVAELDRKLASTVWNKGGCASWYLDETGRNSTLWPGFTLAFRRRARFRAAEYLSQPAPARKRMAPVSAPGSSPRLEAP